MFLCQNPLLGNVLGSSNLASCENFQKKSWKSNSKSKWEKEHPPDELIQKARYKYFPKIHVRVLKSLINECDHFKNDLDSNPCSWIFQIFKQYLGINKIPLFDLNFKNVESL